MDVNDALELVRSIRAGRYEEASVEVKSARQALPKRLWESISAMANRTGGGVIVFGLDEARGFAVNGVADVQTSLANLSNLAAEMEPSLRPSCTTVLLEGKHCIVVEVPEVAPEQKPCYNRQAGLQAGSYIRVGNTNRQMTDYELFGYVTNRSQPQFDREAVRQSSLSDLETGEVEAYLERLRVQRTELWARMRMSAKSLEDRMHAVSIVALESGELRPTLAGLICFGSWPQKYLPSLSVTFVAYAGTTADSKGPLGQRFLDSSRFEGPLPQLVKEAVARTVANMKQSTLVQGIFHRMLPEYPEEAIREAIVNAVAHRDYSPMARGSQVRIEMFSDRLEVQSPGGLFGPVNEENLEQAQSTRNQLLMRFLEELGLVENRGSGIKAMLAAMRDAHLEPPRFSDKRDFFRVTFRNVSLLSSEAVRWLNAFGGYPLSDTQRTALVYLRNNDQMTNSDYRRLNNISDTNYATRELKQMVELGLIEMHASRRWAIYTLAADLKAGADASLLSEHEQRVLALVRQHSEIRRQSVLKELPLSAREATYLLARMVQRGLLERSGIKKGARYRLPSIKTRI